MNGRQRRPFWLIRSSFLSRTMLDSFKQARLIHVMMLSSWEKLKVSNLSSQHLAAACRHVGVTGDQSAQCCLLCLSQTFSAQSDVLCVTWNLKGPANPQSTDTCVFTYVALLDLFSGQCGHARNTLHWYPWPNIWSDRTFNITWSLVVEFPASRFFLSSHNLPVIQCVQ